MSPDPFSGIAAFVRAAEARSFTRAGRLLGVTPSAVSKAVSRLETELGVRLFHRSRREVTLTGEGEDFFRQCRDLVHTAEDARARLCGGSDVRGTLRVCLPVSFAQSVVGPALPAWLAAHPGLKVEMMLTDRYADLAEERLDLALRLGEVPPDLRLVARAMPPHHFVTCAAPDYLACHGTPLRPEDLAGHNCLAYLAANSGAPRLWSFERDGQVQRLRPEGNFVSDQSTLLVHLAEQGSGLVQMPRYLVRQGLDAGRLVPVLADYATLGAPLSVVFPRARQPVRRVQVFADFLIGLGERM